MTVRPGVPLLAACLALGIALAVGYNTFARAADDPTDRATSLIDLVDALETERVGLEGDLASLRERMSGLEARAAEEAGMAESFGRELEDVRALAGLTEVRGEGVVVTLSDADAVPGGQDPDPFVIHDFDVVAVVNALFSGGAEAIEVNGERIAPKTAIRCVGNTVLVNVTRLGVPYVITARGDADTLDAALREDSTAGPLFDAYRTQYGLKTSIQKKSSVTVSAYRGSLGAEYAASVGNGS